MSVSEAVCQPKDIEKKRSIIPVLFEMFWLGPSTVLWFNLVLVYYIISVIWSFCKSLPLYCIWEKKQGGMKMRRIKVRGRKILEKKMIFLTEFGRGKFGRKENEGVL